MRSGQRILRVNQINPKGRNDTYYSWTNRLDEEKEPKNSNILWAKVLGIKVREKFGCEPITMPTLCDWLWKERGYTSNQVKDWIRQAQTFGYIEAIRE